MYWGVTIYNCFIQLNKDINIKFKCKLDNYILILVNYFHKKFYILYYKMDNNFMMIILAFILGYIIKSMCGGRLKE